MSEQTGKTDFAAGHTGFRKRHGIHSYAADTPRTAVVRSLPPKWGG